MKEISLDEGNIFFSEYLVKIGDVLFSKNIFNKIELEIKCILNKCFFEYGFTEELIYTGYYNKFTWSNEKRECINLKYVINNETV